MIKNAKVSISAVRSFRQAVAAVCAYSQKFNKSAICFDEFLRFLMARASMLREMAGKMQSAQNRLISKIKKMEAEIAKLTAEINKLEEQLSSLKSRLSSTPKSHTVTNDKGESHEVPNPAYAAIEREIADTEAELSKVKAELLSVQQRLEHAKDVNGQLVSQVDVINGVVYSLEEKQNVCRQLGAELEKIKNWNLRQGISVKESLEKIEDIVKEYLRNKMKYENAAAINLNNTAFASGVNININVNKTIVKEQTKDPEPGEKNTSVLPEDTVKHQIKYDRDGRICQYDHKTFGGKYTSYEVRLSCTLSDSNPILGHYEGDRGESKYMPSGRTAEGIVVIDILKEYGLDGIIYRNAEPDFEVCAEAVVKIKAMSGHRENYSDSNRIPTMGNFSQADIECAKLWNSQGRGGRTDWCGRDISEYRKAHGLTWHEKCDMETMVLVRHEINDYFRHSGGCSECRMRDTEEIGGGFDED